MRRLRLARTPLLERVIRCVAIFLVRDAAPDLAPVLAGLLLLTPCAFVLVGVARHEGHALHWYDAEGLDLVYVSCVVNSRQASFHNTSFRAPASFHAPSRCFVSYHALFENNLAGYHLRRALSIDVGQLNADQGENDMHNLFGNSAENTGAQCCSTIGGTLHNIM